MKPTILALAIATMPFTPAFARDFCPERPGQATPPCTVERGHAVIESALASWTLQRDADMRSDSFSYGQTLLRVGIGVATEVQVGFTPFGTVRTRDAGGNVDRQGSAGDTMVAIKQVFGNPDQPLAAVKVFATLPTGGMAIGQGTWSGGVAVPIAINLSNKVQLGLTPEIDAAANGDASGRHLAYGGAAGLGFQIGKSATLTTDVSAFRNDDPQGHATMASAGASLAVQPSSRLQLDVGGTAGLTKASPDVTLYVGIARAF